MIIADRSILVLAGATATGKTAASIALAQELPIEIISADARQVYRRLDIGTAKPSLAQQALVRHHCIDIIEPTEAYSAAEFARDARRAIDGVPNDVLPVVVGGSGLYISAALDGLAEDIAPSDPTIRETLLQELEARGRTGLFDELMRVDPRAAERYADMNPRRLVRALEFYRGTGRQFSSTWDSPRNAPNYKVSYFGIALEKETLHARIEQRCDAMWHDGLLAETETVLKSGVPEFAQSLQTVGYAETMSVLRGATSEADAIASMKTNTKRYAKRQTTWFKRDDRYTWLSGTTEHIVDRLLQSVAPALVVLLVTLLLGAGAASNAYAAGTNVTGKPQTRNAAGTTALTAVDSANALKVLRTQLDELFGSAYGRKGSVGVMVYSLKRNAVVYEKNPDAMLTPASTTKLFSTAALFQRLGKDGAIVTEIRTDGALDKEGTLRGNLYIVGNGDALLSVNDLEDVADRLRAMGVKRITGSVIGDGSHFDAVADRAIYSGDGEHVQPTPPVRALSMNKGSVAIVVNGAPNGRVTAQAVPSSDAFEIVVTGAPATKGKRKRRSRVRVSSKTLPSGIQQFVVAGSPGANRSSTTYFNITRPALAVAGTLRSRLRAGGVTVDGHVEERAAPATTTQLASNNRSIVEFSAIVNKRSDNFLAEHVFKAVGAWCGDYNTTATRAKKAILETLDSFDIKRLACSFNDGSGLSRRNLASASTEVALLRSIAEQPWAKEYTSTLAIAGVDGTLRGRMKNTPAENNLVGKTGTLRNVSALAGYVKTRDGEPLVFSFISNGSNVRQYKTIETRAGIALASFSYGNPLTEIDSAALIDTEDPEDVGAVMGQKGAAVAARSSTAAATSNVTKSTVAPKKAVAKRRYASRKATIAKKRSTPSKAKKKSTRNAKKRRR